MWIRASHAVSLARGGDEHLGEVREEPRVEVRGARGDDGGGVRLRRGEEESIHLLARTGSARGDASSRDGGVVARGARERVATPRLRDREFEPSPGRGARHRRLVPEHRR